MVNLSKLLMGAGIALALSACGQSQNAATTAAPPPLPPVDHAAEAAKARVAQQDANEKVVEAFFSGGNPLNHLDLLADDYKQHNPIFVRFGEINHVQGKGAFKLFVETLTKLRASGNPFGPPPGATGPKPPPGNMAYQIMADNDLVTMIHQRNLSDPSKKKGDFYEAYGFDTFRVKDGKLTEHWDDATIPTPVPLYLKVPAKELKFPPQKKQPAT